MPDPKPLPPDAVRLDAFFADQTAWRAELLALRAILTECGLTETFKWSSPVYTAHGGNVAIIWGFRDRAAIGFFKGVLMADPERLLQPPGDNSRSSRIINFTDLAQIRAAAPILRAYIAEAARIEEQGQKVDLPKDDLDYPEELIRGWTATPISAPRSKSLTPGRRRSWVLHFGTAKQAATRLARIDRAAPKILAGKGFNDR